MTTYDPPGGTSISAACREACNLAKTVGGPVEFVFNGTKVTVAPQEHPASIERIWWLTRGIERLARDE